MEFPTLGNNCSFTTCNRLDFLPIKCKGCKGVFCLDHFKYEAHNCPKSLIKDVQVPVCPLCNAPVPGRRGEAPDIAVSAHIDNMCTSDPAVQRRKKVFTNKCNFKGCKTKEMIPVVCSDCKLNFCLKHRHAVDHSCAKQRSAADRSCQSKLAAKRKNAMEAAMARIQLNAETSKKNPEPAATVPSAMSAAASSLTAVQGNMTEDEALAHALARSLEEQQSNRSSDNNFAQALNRQRVGGEQNNFCSVS